MNNQFDLKVNLILCWTVDLRNVFILPKRFYLEMLFFLKLLRESLPNKFSFKCLRKLSTLEIGWTNQIRNVQNVQKNSIPLILCLKKSHFWKNCMSCKNNWNIFVVHVICYLSCIKLQNLNLFQKILICNTKSLTVLFS